MNLDKAINELADLYQYGHLKVSTHPAEFIQEVTQDIKDLRARVKILEEKLQESLIMSKNEIL